MLYHQYEKGSEAIDQAVRSVGDLLWQSLLEEDCHRGMPHLELLHHSKALLHACSKCMTLCECIVLGAVDVVQHWAVIGTHL